MVYEICYRSSTKHGHEYIYICERLFGSRGLYWATITSHILTPLRAVVIVQRGAFHSLSLLLWFVCVFPLSAFLPPRARALVCTFAALYRSEAMRVLCVTGPRYFCTHLSMYYNKLLLWCVLLQWPRVELTVVHKCLCSVALLLLVWYDDGRCCLLWMIIVVVIAAAIICIWYNEPKQR